MCTVGKKIACEAGIPLCGAFCGCFGMGAPCAKILVMEGRESCVACTFAFCSGVQGKHDTSGAITFSKFDFPCRCRRLDRRMNLVLAQTERQLRVPLLRSC